MTDQSTFTDAARRMRPMLMGVARGIVGNDAEAEDVVQDALLRLWQLRDEPIRNLPGMARVVVRHLSLDVVRRRRPSVPLGGVGQGDAADGPDATGDSSPDELVERMMALVARLPAMQQAVLRLRHMEGMSTTDIATLTGTTEAAVRQSLSRARRAVISQFRNQQNKE